MVICSWLKKLNCPPMCDNSLHMPLKCIISFHVRGACAEHDFFSKHQRQLTNWAATRWVSCLRLTEFVSTDSKPKGLQSCRLFPWGGLCKVCPFLWDLRFGEREGGGGIAGCIPYEGEDWLGDVRGCLVLYEGGEEIGQVGMRRGRYAT